MSVTMLNVPVGTIIDYAGSGTPSGYLVCEGQAVSRTTYPALFAAIGTTWGTGDGSTTFNVPDLRGRTAIGAGTGTAGGATAHVLASKGGDERMQSHQHAQKSLTGYFTVRRDTEYPSGNPTDMTRVLGATGVFSKTTEKVNAGAALPTWTWPNNVDADKVNINVTHQHDSAGGGSSQNMQPFATVRKLIRAA